MNFLTIWLNVGMMITGKQKKRVVIRCTGNKLIKWTGVGTMRVLNHSHTINQMRWSQTSRRLGRILQQGAVIDVAWMIAVEPRWSYGYVGQGGRPDNVLTDFAVVCGFGAVIAQYKGIRPVKFGKQHPECLQEDCVVRRSAGECGWKTRFVAGATVHSNAIEWGLIN